MQRLASFGITDRHCGQGVLGAACAPSCYLLDDHEKHQRHNRERDHRIDEEAKFSVAAPAAFACARVS
jgi:hypothetical protein